MNKALLTPAIAAAGAGAGGYYVGYSMDVSSAPTSALTSKAVMIPAVAGVLGWFLLRKKKASAAKGLLYGGLAGAAYGYYKYGTDLAAAGPAAPAISAAPGRRRRRMGAYLGARPGSVARILNSKSGSGLGNILPRRIQSGNPAFKSDAWARK